MTKTLERKRGIVEKPQNGNGSKLTHEQFVLAWQAAHDFPAFLIKTEIGAVKAKAQANYLRKKGVNLKFLVGVGRQRINVSQLNELISSNAAN